VSAEQHLFQFNFVDEMRSLERRCSEAGTRELNDLHELFGDVDDGLFAFLVSRAFSEFDGVKSVLPGWAPDDIRHNSTGRFTFREHVLDASWFWRTVRQEFEKITDSEIRRAIVADYGAGWGRIARFVNKDVPAKQFYALEPNPVFQKIYSECRLPGTLVPTDWASKTTSNVKNVDLIISYSILTHSSERLTRNIVDRWAEMTKPGSLLAFTIRPGFYLEETDGDMSVFAPEEHAQLPERYSRGEFIYAPYDGSVDWGVTIIPLEWLNELLEGRFRLQKCSFQLQTSNQMIVFATRL
jgi:hypothetical protein